MPMSLDVTGAGYITFCAIKLVGYTLVSKKIGGDYPESQRPVAAVGATRTLIGMGVGALYSQMFLGQISVPVYWALLFPIRMLEWGFVIWLFYDRQARQPQRGFFAALFGTVWSYILDVPAVIGFVVTGGISIC
jgi:hypothetical protein